MFEKTIISHKELEVRVSDHANQAMLEILSQAVQGSEGGFRFQLQNIPARIDAYGDQIRFVTLYRRNKVTGTVGSCYRVTGQGKLRYSSSHLRYLAFLSVYQTSYKPGKKRKDLIKTEKDDTF